VFTNEAKFQIFVHVSWHKYIIWGSEPLREHSEHELVSPKVNVWCVLTHEKSLAHFLFDEDIVTTSLFLDILENYGLPELNRNSNLFFVEHQTEYQL
jgi:hypothetical protein